MVGAIGISGVTSSQDAQVAQAGIDALAEILRLLNRSGPPGGPPLNEPLRLTKLNR
jgi:hypothetical protein